MALLLYVTNLLLAVPLALACRAVLAAGFGASMAPANLMGGFDYTAWQDFSSAHGQELSAIIRQLSWLILIAMLLNAFLSGGILGQLRAGKQKFSASIFFAGCGNYFLRFFRLFLLFGFSFFLVAIVLAGILGAAGDALTANATSEITVFWVRVAAAVIFLVPVIIVLMIADYAKIIVVVKDDRSMLKTAWRVCEVCSSPFLPNVWT